MQSSLKWEKSSTWTGVSEAPANRLKMFAKAAIDECGDLLSSKVLTQAANTKSLQNAERDLLSLLRKCGMTIPIRPTLLSFGVNKVEVPCICLKTWWPYLLTSHSSFVLGGFGMGPMSKLLLETYWKNMEMVAPDHAIFLTDDRPLECCVPFFLHLDEGVGQRKKAVLVINAQTVFGQETASRYMDFYTSCRGRTTEDAQMCMSQAMFHSSRGSTYTTRFLVSAIAKKNYAKKNDDVFVGLLDLLAEECSSLFESGVNIRGKTFYPVCMGLKGDAPALAKAGFFSRYFGTMGKNKGCCYECMAGFDGYDFENVSPTASWIATIGLERPWRPNRVSPLSRIPTQIYKPESFYKKDPFHVFKQSLGGYFLASSIVVLACDLGLFTFHAGQSAAVQNVLDRAHEDYDYYVKYEWRGKKNSHLKSFTKETFHFPKVASYPYARFKGGDCMMLLRWLRHLMLNGVVDPVLKMRPGVPLTDVPNPLQAKLCKEILKACQGGIDFFHILHNEGIWIKLSLAKEMACKCQDFCDAYASLAKVCFDQAWTRYRLEPCLHQFVHFAVELRQSMALPNAGAMFHLSPSPLLCEADEDFVGKICRLSRHVHMQSMSQRTIDRYLVKLWFEVSGTGL